MVGDAVVGAVVERHSDAYNVDLGGPFTAVLPALAFEGATRRNRPNLAQGDLVYARVTAASRDADPEIACTDAAGKVHCAFCKKAVKHHQSGAKASSTKIIVYHCSQLVTLTALHKLEWTGAAQFHARDTLHAFACWISQI